MIFLCIFHVALNWSLILYASAIMRHALLMACIDLDLPEAAATVLWEIAHRYSIRCALVMGSYANVNFNYV